MKTHPPIAALALLGAALPVAAQEDFCHSPLGISHLLTPGTATCEVMGPTTSITLFANTIIEWDSIVLMPDQRLEFAFTNPQHTVVNHSRGTAIFPVPETPKPTFIGGTLHSNGNVVILSPDNLLQFTNDARVEVGSLTASGLGGDPAQFFANSGEIELNATPLTNPTTLIRGEITTTQGDLVVAGKDLEIIAQIESAGSVTAVTGTTVRLNRSGRRVNAATGGSQIIQSGSIRAQGDIEFASQQAISMAGEFVPGKGAGRFYARVDDDGQLLVGPAGLTVRGTAIFSTPPLGEIATIGPNDNNPGTRSPAVNEFPVFGQKRSNSRTRPSGSSITARAPSSFSKTTRTSKRKPAPSPRKDTVKSSSISGLRKRSFYRTSATLTAKKG